MQTLKAMIHCYKDGLGLAKHDKLTMVKEDILLELKLASGCQMGLRSLFKERYSKDKVGVQPKQCSASLLAGWPAVLLLWIASGKCIAAMAVMSP